MRLKPAFQLAAVLSTLLFGIHPVWATANLFTPMTGDMFNTDSPSVVLKNAGLIFNNDSATSHIVFVSLGHAQGGTNGFTVYGANNGFTSDTTSCTVYVQPTTTGSFFNYSNSFTGVGNFSIFIQTTPSGGDYFYFLQCAIPRFHGSFQSWITGVVPNH